MRFRFSYKENFAKSKKPSSLSVGFLDVGKSFSNRFSPQQNSQKSHLKIHSNNDKKMDYSKSSKGKKFSIEVEECRSVFQKMRGLMFRKKSKPLLFIFKKPAKTSIHSFFCLPFVAIWFSEGKIIEKKYVKPWKIFVKPAQKFDKLLEIPSGNEELRFFIDERKI